MSSSRTYPEFDKLKSQHNSESPSVVLSSRTYATWLWQCSLTHNSESPSVVVYALRIFLRERPASSACSSSPVFLSYRGVSSAPSAVGVSPYSCLYVQSSMYFNFQSSLSIIVLGRYLFLFGIKWWGCLLISGLSLGFVFISDSTWYIALL